MSARPQLAASPDEIHYWTQSDWWPVWLVLERWGVPEPQCLEAKRQALLSACERGQVQWRRSDGKPYDDPIHELAARNRVLIERSSFAAWSRTLPERRRVAVPAALPTVQQPAAGLAVAHIAIVHSRTHTEVLERPSAANDPVPLVTEVVTPALVPLPSQVLQVSQADLDTCTETGTAASSNPNPQVATTSWSLVTQLQGSAAISSTPRHDYASYPSEAELRKLGVPTQEIIDAFKVRSDPKENARWFRERMSNIKRANKGLAAALVQKGLPSRGMQHYPSYWRPDLVAAWLIDKKHMSRHRVIHILQTRFPEWADLADYL
jgi:hypothetical protein